VPSIWEVSSASLRIARPPHSTATRAQNLSIQINTVYPTLAVSPQHFT